MINKSETIKAMQLIFSPEIRKIGHVIVKHYERRQDAIIWSKVEDLEMMLQQHETEKTSLGFAFAVRRLDFRFNGFSQGSKQDCAAIQTLQVDFDSLQADKDEGRPLSPDSKDAVVSAMRDAPLKPTMVIDSGGGVHGYWILKRPVILKSNLDINRIESINRTLMNYFKSLKLPCVVDTSVADVAHLMRLPGSINFRYKTPMPVRILEVFDVKPTV